MERTSRAKRAMRVIIALVSVGFLIALGSVGALELEMIGFKRFFFQEGAGMALIGIGALVAKIYEPIL